MVPSHDGETLPADSPAERILVFHLGGKLHAIRVTDIGGVVRCEALRELTGSPPGVLGLAEWRGSVLAVLDLPQLLGLAAPAEPACLIRLAPPLDQTALHLPVGVQLSEQRLVQAPVGAGCDDEQRWRCGDEEVVLVDPGELVRRLEAEMRKRA